MPTGLEVAEVFRRYGEAYRQVHAEHLGRTERRVMGAIAACRTAALGGHADFARIAAWCAAPTTPCMGICMSSYLWERPEGSPPMGGKHRAATLYSVGSVLDPDHEAVIPFDGEAPRRRAHSADGIEAMELFGSPPPRLVIDGQSRKRDWAPKLCVCVARPPTALRPPPATQRRPGFRRS